MLNKIKLKKLQQKFGRARHCRFIYYYLWNNAGFHRWKGKSVWYCWSTAQSCNSWR